MKTAIYFPTEKTSARMVYIYTILLSLACLFITLSPVFGQDDENSGSDKPNVKVKVNKQYDEEMKKLKESQKDFDHMKK